ncbi:MAG: ApbE family lipoprotein [Acidimicrobiales bacterium]|jgi:thiamine biosynthesis lipoprotein|nr:ApbE family lipoprotein [Acidimicrobiales bacterium]
MSELGPLIAPARTLRVEPHWGTMITLDVRDRIDVDLVDRTFRWFRRVDDLFSTWRPDSEISRLARRELTIDETDADVREVLELCDQFFGDSGGAFDIRVGAHPDVRPREGLGPIDPSGMVKGWALQRAASCLRDAGVNNFTINAGGDVVCAGHAEPGANWRVGIQHPWRRDRVAAVVDVSDLGVATSGRYERGDHIIDPRTNVPAIGLMSVTVIASDLAIADGYATAALVLGREGMEWLSERDDVAAMAIADDTTVVTTGSFDRHRVS